MASGFPCLLFAPDGKAFAPMAKLAEKLRAQHPALICFAHDPAFLACSETAVRIPDAVAEWVSPLVYAVAAQLFVYWLAVARGNDPDAPRGLSKVTTDGLRDPPPRFAGVLPKSRRIRNSPSTQGVVHS